MRVGISFEDEPRVCAIALAPKDRLPQFRCAFVVSELFPELPALVAAEFASFEEAVQFAVRETAIVARLIEGRLELEESVERRCCSSGHMLRFCSR